MPEAVCQSRREKEPSSSAVGWCPPGRVGARARGVAELGHAGLPPVGVDEQDLRAGLGVVGPAEQAAEPCHAGILRDAGGQKRRFQRLGRVLPLRRVGGLAHRSGRGDAERVEQFRARVVRKLDEGALLTSGKMYSYIVCPG
jgi:hypothetical protein